jgi:hypothetical protein
MVLILSAAAGFAQPQQTVTVEFRRTIQENGVDETVQGNIYYDGQKTFLITRSPILQWMIIENSQLLIYYPEEQKAIRILTQNPASLPFFQAFVGIVDEDAGLAKLGYSISKNEVRNDTLFIHWKPAAKVEKILGEYVYALYNNKIVYTVMKTPKGGIASRTYISDYTGYNGRFFPHKIHSILYNENSEVHEIIAYSNAAFGKPLPDDVLNFRLPDGIDVKEIAW